MFFSCSRWEKKIHPIPNLQNTTYLKIQSPHNWPCVESEWNYPAVIPNRSTRYFLINCIDQPAGTRGTCIITGWIQQLVDHGHCSWLQGRQSWNPIITSAADQRLLEGCQDRGIPLDCISYVDASQMNKHRWAWCSPRCQAGRVSVWNNLYFNFKILWFGLVQENKIFTV